MVVWKWQFYKLIRRSQNRTFLAYGATGMLKVSFNYSILDNV